MSKKIAIIPARSGSKGIPQKNFRSFAGSSLLALASQTALESGVFDSLLISTDAPERVPSNLSDKKLVRVVTRSDQASSDVATASQVLQELIDTELTALDLDTTLVYLQPTSPFRSVESIRSAIELFEKNKIPVISVKKTGKKIQKLAYLDSDNFCMSTLPGHFMNGNRQALPDELIMTGSIYVFSIGQFRESNIFPVDRFLPLYQDQLESIDVDSMEDFLEAESEYKKLKNLHE